MQEQKQQALPSEIADIRQRLISLFGAKPRASLTPNRAYQKMMSKFSKTETFPYKYSIKPNGIFGISKRSEIIGPDYEEDRNIEMDEM